MLKVSSNFKGIMILSSMIFMWMFFFIVGCIRDKSTTVQNTSSPYITTTTTNSTTQQDVSTDVTLIRNTVKTYKSIDIVAHMLYSTLGDLYKLGHVTEEQKLKLITLGNIVREQQALTKAAIESYMWSDVYTDTTSDTYKRDKLINTLVKFVKAFYNMKDEVASTYKQVTGQDIKIPDIFMFDTLTDLLYQ